MTNVFRALLRPLAWRARRFLLHEVTAQLRDLQLGQAALVRGGEPAAERAVRPAEPRRVLRRKVHQFHAGSATGDAITNAMLLVQSELRGLGYASEIYVEHIGAGLENRLLPLAALPDGDDFVLLVHHSMGHGAVARLLASPAPKILIYHNITPPDLLSYNRGLRDAAILGRTQLAVWREHVVAAIADSAFNGVELRQLGYTCVLEAALLFDVAKLGGAGARDAAAPYTVLFVGRLVPGKGQAELIEAFALFASSLQHKTGRAARLVLIGAEQDYAPGIRAMLERLAASCGVANAVHITGKLPDAALHCWYRHADLYVSLSAHEGFGVPLVEAMAYGIPVLARRAGAVAETLGPGARLLDHAGPEHVAAAMLQLAQDELGSARLVARQTASLSRFELKRHLAVLQQALLLAGMPPGQSTETHAALRQSLQLDVRGAATARLTAALERHRPWVLATGPAVPGELLVQVAGDPGEFVRQVPRLVLQSCDCRGISIERMRALNDGANAVLVASASEAQWLVEFGVAVPICVIGHGDDHAGAWIDRILTAAADSLCRPMLEYPRVALAGSGQNGSALAQRWRTRPVLVCEKDGVTLVEAIGAADADVVLIQHEPRLLPWADLAVMLRSPVLRRRCLAVMLPGWAELPPLPEPLRQQVCDALALASVVLAPFEALAVLSKLGLRHLRCAPAQEERLEGMLTGLWRQCLDGTAFLPDTAALDGEGVEGGYQRADRKPAAAGLERRHR